MGSKRRQTSAPTTGGAPAAPMTAQATSRMVDPNLVANVESVAQAVDVAPGKGAPNRLTFVVPTEETVLSLGEAEPKRIDDVGITGRTKRHVHWEALEPRTIVSLGTVPTSTQIGRGKEFDGLGGVGEIENGEKQPEGFAVATDRKVWMRSIGALTLASVGEGSSLESEMGKVLVRAKEKEAIIEGHEAVTVASAGHVKIAATQHAALSVTGVESAIGNKILNDWFTKPAVKLGDFLKTCYTLWQSYAKLKPTIQKNGKWATAKTWDGAKLVVDMAKGVSTTLRAVSGWGSNEGGKVTIDAQTYASLNGGVATSVWGQASLTLSSLLSASLLGGTASVTGLAWASVWSYAGTSIKSRKDVGLEGETGKCTVKGATETKLESTEGTVFVSGKKRAQISSPEGEVVINGGDLVYIGGGIGSGYGLTLTADAAILGKYSNPNDLETVKSDETEQVSVGGQKISLRAGGSSISLEGGGIKLSSKNRPEAVQVDDDFKILKVRKVFLL